MRSYIEKYPAVRRFAKWLANWLFGRRVIWVDRGQYWWTEYDERMECAMVQMLFDFVEKDFKMTEEGFDKWKADFREEAASEDEPEDAREQVHRYIAAMDEVWDVYCYFKWELPKVRAAETVKLIEWHEDQTDDKFYETIECETAMEEQLTEYLVRLVQIRQRMWT